MEEKEIKSFYDYDFFGDWVPIVDGITEEEAKTYLTLWKKILLAKLKRPCEEMQWVVKGPYEGQPKTIGLKFSCEKKGDETLYWDGLRIHPL